jgi:hypothetical protein
MLLVACRKQDLKTLSESPSGAAKYLPLKLSQTYEQIIHDAQSHTLILR